MLLVWVFEFSSHINALILTFWICVTEATFEVLPRLNDIKFGSGVIDELLFLELPREQRFPYVKIFGKQRGWSWVTCFHSVSFYCLNSEAFCVLWMLNWQFSCFNMLYWLYFLFYCYYIYTAYSWSLLHIDFHFYFIILIIILFDSLWLLEGQRPRLFI